MSGAMDPERLAEAREFCAGRSSIHAARAGLLLDMLLTDRDHLADRAERAEASAAALTSTLSRVDEALGSEAGESTEDAARRVRDECERGARDRDRMRVQFAATSDRMRGERDDAMRRCDELALRVG